MSADNDSVIDIKNNLPHNIHITASDDDADDNDTPESELTSRPLLKQTPSQQQQHKHDDHDHDHDNNNNNNKKKKKKKNNVPDGGIISALYDMDNIEQTGASVEQSLHTGQRYILHPVHTGISAANNNGKYDVKMHMTNERTFFKYLFATFQLGAMGTFLLTYYGQPSLYKPLLIGIIWGLSLLFLAMGLCTYYQRRSFLLQGKMKDLTGLWMHGPTYVSLSFCIVFLSILVYSVATHQIPTKTQHKFGDDSTGKDDVPLPINAFLPV